LINHSNGGTRVPIIYLRGNGDKSKGVSKIIEGE
jgi:hypothetical protein